MKRIRRIVLLLLPLLCLCSVTVTAAGVPYRTYTISADYEELASPAAYLPAGHIDSASLQLETAITAPSDMQVYDGRLYLLDGGTGRVLVLDEAFTVLYEIDGYDAGEERRAFKNPQGLTLSPTGELYVTDTDNRCIVKMTRSGETLRVFGAPAITALGEDYDFFPLKIGVDNADRMYIIARGINRGLLVMDQQGLFVSFSGTPRVTYDLFTMIWKTLLPRSASKSLQKFVPTEFSNLYLDEESFVYTTIRSVDSTALYAAVQSHSQTSVKLVQRFNATGADVLRRYGDVPIVGDVNWKLPSTTAAGVTAAQDSTEGPSAFEDIVVDETGCYYCVDSYRGRIFAYDHDGNLLYAFGGNANCEGNVITASAIELFAGRLIVLDRQTAQIVCYEMSDYGKALRDAALLFADGQYEQAAAQWREVAKSNGNLTLAYIGLGKCAYRMEDYQTAMRYLKLANEKTYYSKAYQAARSEAVSRYFGWIFAGVLLLLVLLFLLVLGVFHRKEPKAALDPAAHPVRCGLRYALHLPVHPFAGFWELKHEKRGNAVSGTVILGLAIISHLFRQQYSGYLFSTYNAAKYNAFTEILTVLLPVLLWVLANWCLTTLMDGEGNMKDIYVATTYALAPMVLLIPLTLISNVMSLGEASYYQFFLSLIFFCVGFLIFFGTMITHQYSLLKTLFTCALILIGIVVILFIGILFYNLIQRILSFVISSWQEISFHVSG